MWPSLLPLSLSSQVRRDGLVGQESCLVAAHPGRFGRGGGGGVFFCLGTKVPRHSLEIDVRQTGRLAVHLEASA